VSPESGQQQNDKSGGVQSRDAVQKRKSACNAFHLPQRQGSLCVSLMNWGFLELMYLAVNKFLMGMKAFTYMAFFAC
jgi:hypothetical protein